MGNNASKFPEVVKLIASKGHEIALHAGEHKDFLKLIETFCLKDEGEYFVGKHENIHRSRYIYQLRGTHG